MDIIEVIKELNLFSNKLLALKEPVNILDVSRFENDHNLKLPNDYIRLLQVTNGFSLMSSMVYGIDNSSMSIGAVYSREHTEVENPIFEYLVPFSPDGGGNHYCFDLRTINEYSANVVFWQHDYPYTENDPPEIANNSFAEWMKEVIIEWNRRDQ